MDIGPGLQRFVSRLACGSAGVAPLGRRGLVIRGLYRRAGGYLERPCLFGGACARASFVCGTVCVGRAHPLAKGPTRWGLLAIKCFSGGRVPAEPLRGNKNPRGTSKPRGYVRSSLFRLNYFASCAASAAGASASPVAGTTFLSSCKRAALPESLVK